ncbi:MAG: PRC-barrel domain-containing protein [Solirubrobacterales bacterium]
MLSRITVSVALAAVLGAPAFAQQAGRDQGAQRQVPALSESRDTRSAGNVPMDQLAMAQVDTIKSSKVRNLQGDDVGDIKDLVLDMPRGRIAFAVVGVGGFLGVGEKNVAVPWDRLRPGDRAETFVLNVDKQTLKSAPAIKLDEVASLQQSQVRDQVDTFWRGVPQQAQANEPARGGVGGTQAPPEQRHR